MSLLLRKTGIPCLVLLTAVTALALPGIGRAAQFSLLPFITQEVRYNDNILFNSLSQTHDFISYTRGGIRLLDKTERFDLDVSALGAQSFYKDNTSLNSTDVITYGSARYILTPKFSLSGRGNYTRDSQPDREVETTGLVLTGIRREHYTFGASSDYQLTEKTLASLGYDHMADHYAGAGTVNSRSNVTSDAASLSFQHDLSKLIPATTGLFSVGYSNYSLTGVDVNNYEGTAGLKYALHENWSLQVAAGPRYTESSVTATVLTPVPFGPLTLFVPVEQKTNESGWGGVGQAILDYRGEKNRANLTAARDIAPASGFNGTVERTSFIFSGSRRFTYEFRGIVTASYFINKSSSGLSATPINFVTYNISPGIRYDFNKDMYLEGSYTFTRVEDRQAETRADRNLFLVRFFLQHPVME
jgi:hypothetical protein